MINNIFVKAIEQTVFMRILSAPAVTSATLMLQLYLRASTCVKTWTIDARVLYIPVQNIPHSYLSQCNAAWRENGHLR